MSSTLRINEALIIAMMAYLSVWLRREEGYESMHVIALAQRSSLQNLLMERFAPAERSGGPDVPLVAAVQLMKNRLLDLLRSVLPVASPWCASIRAPSSASTGLGRSIKPGARRESIDTSPIWADPDTWMPLMARIRVASEKLISKTGIMRTPGTTAHPSCASCRSPCTRTSPR